jgi:DNA-directed RNA polymerase specialized sigma subunit
MRFVKIKLPPQLTEKEASELLPCVRTGDEKAKQRMIEGYIRLVAAITARQVVKYPHKAHELFSVALLALVTAIDRVSKNIGCETHDNVSAYVHKYVRCELLEFVKIDHVVKPPLNSAWLMQKLKEHGREFLYYEFGCIPYVEDVPDSTEQTESLLSADRSNQRFMLPPKLLRDANKEFDFSQIELLESDFFTTREKIILKMRIEGYTNERIGRAIGYTEARVGQLIKEMEKRVKKIVKGLV